MIQDLVQNAQNRLIAAKASEVGIACSPLIPGCEDFLELSYNGRKIVINKTRSHRLPLIAGLLAKNKDASSLLLKRAGLPVPDYIVVYRMSKEAAAFLHSCRSVAVKPLDASRSEGVTIGIDRLDELGDAIETASAYSDRVIIQRFIDGYDYRVLVIEGKVEGVLEYRPAFIEGDGCSTAAELIRRLNEEMTRHNKSGGFQRLDTIDLASGTLFTSLKKQGMTLRDIPDKGMRVELYVIENVPAGEISEINIDRTEEICPFNANAAVEAARALNIDVAGIDIRCRDIGVPLDLSGGGILEVNALPDMIDHVYPFQGASRDVVKAYLRYLFREGASDQ